jgi:predicted RNA-binding Zn ribbon-like protein
METVNDVARMRVVGGDLTLDFVNTRSGPPDGPPDDDVLLRYDDLAAWAHHIGVLSGGEAAALRRRAGRDPAGAEAVYRRALRIRDDLDHLFRPAAGRAGEQLARLRDDAADAFAHGEIAAQDGGFRWCWTGDRSLGRPLWPIVHAAVELLTAGPLDRIKACAGCRFLFLDETKNRSRRWCSMEDCGTAEKIRRYVARRADNR